MKNILLIFVSILIHLVCYSQTIERDVVCNSGDHFENPEASISWTLGEVATETYSSGNIILTQGFQQSVEGIIISGIDLDLLVYLEGPFNGMDMNNLLYANNYLPLVQPYNIAPWNYNGTESVGSIPNPNVVDWVLVELRDAIDAVSAHPGTTVAMQAAFLLSDGSVVDLDGSSVLNFNHSISHSLFVAVWHRNHLGIMSANDVTESGGIYTYDFSSSEGQVYGNDSGHKILGPGIWGMIAGDGNKNGGVTPTDISEWAEQAGLQGYLLNDYSMNGQVNNQDKNDILIHNIYSSTQVPD